jgi:hypothetical protein
MSESAGAVGRVSAVRVARCAMCDLRFAEPPTHSRLPTPSRSTRQAGRARAGRSPTRGSTHVGCPTSGTRTCATLTHARLDPRAARRAGRARAGRSPARLDPRGLPTSGTRTCGTLTHARLDPRGWLTGTRRLSDHHELLARRPDLRARKQRSENVAAKGEKKQRQATRISDRGAERGGCRDRDRGRPRSSKRAS